MFPMLMCGAYGGKYLQLNQIFAHHFHTDIDLLQPRDFHVLHDAIWTAKCFWLVLAALSGTPLHFCCLLIP